MKKTALTFLALLTVFVMVSQDITGQWHGLLEIPGSPLRLVINIEKSDSAGYTPTLDSPDQGAKGIAVNTTTFADGKLEIAANALGLTYTAELIEDKLKEP